MLVSDWLGWSRNAVFERNSFYVRGGTLRFGHSTARKEDGTYEIAPGWGPAEGIVYSSNRYAGNIVSPPDDYRPSSEDLHEPEINWDEPSFDASRPQDYPAFLAAHRAWIVQLFQNQFGRTQPYKGEIGGYRRRAD